MITTVASPAMKLLTGNTNQIDKSSTIIPVLNGWTASRNLDPMSNKKFRTWFAEHKKEAAQKQRFETAKAVSAACRNASKRGEE